MTDLDAERQRHEDATIAILADSIIQEPDIYSKMEREIATSERVEAAAERVITNADLHRDHVLEAAQRVRQAARLERMRS